MHKILKTDIKKFQVSSVIRNDKNFGKNNIFDGSEETCWTSSEGTPQWVLVELKKKYSIAAFSIQFQGGFVGQSCSVELRNDEEVTMEPYYPEDVNSVQKFSLTKPVVCSQIKFLFDGSTDFFGRIVVYGLDIYYNNVDVNFNN